MFTIIQSVFFLKRYIVSCVYEKCVVTNQKRSHCYCYDRYWSSATHFQDIVVNFCVWICLWCFMLTLAFSTFNYYCEGGNATSPWIIIKPLSVSRRYLFKVFQKFGSRFFVIFGILGTMGIVIIHCNYLSTIIWLTFP